MNGEKGLVPDCNTLTYRKVTNFYNGTLRAHSHQTLRLMSEKLKIQILFFVWGNLSIRLKLRYQISQIQSKKANIDDTRHALQANLDTKM